MTDHQGMGEDVPSSEPFDTEEVPTIDTKPAAGVWTAALTTLGLSLANRYTSYQPTIEETGAILIIVTGLGMWLIPSTIRRKLNGSE